jgi:hypothetical protein
MREEIAIESIEAQPGATIRKLAKGEYSNPYVKYALPVVYVLADGRRVETTETYNLLRDAKADLAAMPHAPKHDTSACFGPTGEFWGTTTSFRLTGSGLTQ